jgi:mRNA interferase MazF
MYHKDFDGWNIVKKHIESEERRVHIRAGEIRWVAFGVNVGSEIDGKGVSFTRPAVIVHVVGSHLALVVPMSTSAKEIAGYVPFEWKGRVVALCVHQTRIVSQKRVLSRKGKIAPKRLEKVKDEIAKFFRFPP